MLAVEADEVLANFTPVNTTSETLRIKQRHHTRRPQRWVQSWLEKAYSDEGCRPVTKEEAFSRARADYNQQHPDEQLSRRQFEGAWTCSAPDAAKKGGRPPRKT